MGFHSRLKLGTFPGGLDSSVTFAECPRATAEHRATQQDLNGDTSDAISGNVGRAVNDQLPRSVDAARKAAFRKKAPQGCDQRAKGIRSSSTCVALFGSNPLNIYQ